jgi:hypothetical protein
MRARTALRDLQHSMQRHLLGETSETIADIVDAPPLPAADRLAIYRNAYQVRLIDALHDTYPVLHGLLGDEMWRALGEAYVASHPSTFRSIRWYGAELADFVYTSSPYRDEPILGEVARLEWMLSEVFDAPDAAFLPRAALEGVDPEMWGGLKFDFHPSLRCLELHWNAAAVWKAMSRDETPPTPAHEAAPVPWVLWRRDLQNYFRSMTRAESAALNAAQRGLSFGEICEVLSAILPAEEVPPAAAGYLGAWADGGMLMGLR